MKTDPPSHAAPRGRARVGRRSYQRAAPNGAFNPRCATADPGIQTLLSVRQTFLPVSPKSQRAARPLGAQAVRLCSVCTGVRGEPSKKLKK